MRVLSASGLAVCRVRYNAPFRQTWLSLAQHSRECAMLLKEKNLNPIAIHGRAVLPGRRYFSGEIQSMPFRHFTNQIAGA